MPWCAGTFTRTFATALRCSRTERRRSKWRRQSKLVNGRMVVRSSIPENETENSIRHLGDLRTRDYLTEVEVERLATATRKATCCAALFGEPVTYYLFRILCWEIQKIWFL